MAGAGDSDPDVRLNTPEDENLLRAFRPQSASSLPVYQPSSSADVSTPTAPATALPGTVVVRVPAAAQVWFDDSSTRSTGTERSFQTPTLTAGKTYRYDIKVRWLQDGKPVDVTRSARRPPWRADRGRFPRSQSLSDRRSSCIEFQVKAWGGRDCRPPFEGDAP